MCVSIQMPVIRTLAQTDCKVYKDGNTRKELVGSDERGTRSTLKKYKNVNQLKAAFNVQLMCIDRLAEKSNRKKVHHTTRQDKTQPFIHFYTLTKCSRRLSKSRSTL